MQGSGILHNDGKKSSTTLVVRAGNLLIAMAAHPPLRPGVPQEGTIRYGGRSGCFLRVVDVKNEGSTVTATSSTTPASASTSRAVCFVYKLATRDGLYQLLTGSPMIEEPVITTPPAPPPCECHAAAHGDVEVRIDRDGNPHTEACFCSYYGAEGEQRWASASPAAPLNHSGA